MIGLIFIVAWVGVTVFVAYPLADKSFARAGMMVALSSTTLIYAWIKGLPFVRFHSRRLLNYIFGPYYMIRAGASFRTSLAGNDPELLQIGLQTAKDVFKPAHRESAPSNRILIAAGKSRTIRLDILWEWEEDEADELDKEDDEAHEIEGGRILSMEIWGYEGNLTRLSKLVENEIVPFMDKLGTALKAEGVGRNYWLSATSDKRNPFLDFYLRDVPDAQVSKFQLEFTREMAGDPVWVVFGKEGFNFSAPTPRPFPGLIRDYSSTPALSDSNRN